MLRTRKTTQVKDSRFTSGVALASLCMPIDSESPKNEEQMSKEMLANQMATIFPERLLVDLSAGLFLLGSKYENS